jgi:hypothetical protein
LLHPRDPRILAIATDSPNALPPGAFDRLQVFSLSDADAIATFVAAQATPTPLAIDFK